MREKKKEAEAIECVRATKLYCKWCGIVANSTLLSYSAVHRLQKSRMTFLMVVALILIIGRAREKRLGEDRAKKWCLSVLCKESENVCKSAWGG